MFSFPLTTPFMDPAMYNTTTCNNQQQTQYYNTSGVSGYMETESSNCMYYRPQQSFPTSSQYDHKYDTLQNYHEIERNMPFNMSLASSTSSMSSSSPLIHYPSQSYMSPSIPQPHYPSQSHMSPSIPQPHYPSQIYTSHSIPQSVLYQSSPSLPFYPSYHPNPPTLDPPDLRRDTQQNARPMMELQHVERWLKDDSDKKWEKCQCPSCQGITPKYDTNGKRLHLCHMKNCKRTYSKTSHLKAHLRWHTGKRPYVCNWLSCDKTFHRSDELKRHLRTHTGEKTYQCPKCDSKFMRSDHLKKHVKTHENRENTRRPDGVDVTRYRQNIKLEQK